MSNIMMDARSMDAIRIHVHGDSVGRIGMWSYVSSLKPCAIEGGTVHIDDQTTEFEAEMSAVMHAVKDHRSLNCPIVIVCKHYYRCSYLVLGYKRPATNSERLYVSWMKKQMAAGMRISFSREDKRNG